MCRTAPAVGLMTETTHVISRSLLSKSVPKADVGKVIGLMSILDIIAPLVVIPIYNLIYKNTLTTFPGGAFLFSVGITLPAMAIFLYVMSNKGMISTYLCTLCVTGICEFSALCCANHPGGQRGVSLTWTLSEYQYYKNKTVPINTIIIRP